MRFLLAMILLFSIAKAETEEVRFSDEELAKESVLPKFDQVIATKNRNVTFSSKWETGLFGGMNLTEAIFSSYSYGLNLSYHLNEDHAITVKYNKMMSGLSSYANQIYNIYPYNPVDFNRAPAPSQYLLAMHEYKMFYGKMSFTKEGVANLSLYSLLGLGMISFPSKSYPALSVGLGQKFYFSPKWNLRFDLHVLGFNGPSPYVQDKLKTYNPGTTTPQPAPTASDFSEKFQYATHLDVGVGYLF